MCATLLVVPITMSLRPGGGGRLISTSNACSTYTKHNFVMMDPRSSKLENRVAVLHRRTVLENRGPTATNCKMRSRSSKMMSDCGDLYADSNTCQQFTRQSVGVVRAGPHRRYNTCWILATRWPSERPTNFSGEMNFVNGNDSSIACVHLERVRVHV